MGPSWKKFSSRLSLVDDVKNGKDGKDRKRDQLGVPISRPIQQEVSSQQDSLPSPQQRIQDHEGPIREHGRTIDEQRSEIEVMREEQQMLQAQNRSISDQLNDARREVDNLCTHATDFGEQIQNLKWQLQVESARFASLTNSCNEKDQEILARSNTIRVLSGHNQQLQTRVIGLENILAMARRKTGMDLQAFFDCYSELEKAHNEIGPKLKAEEDLRQNLQEAMQAMEFEVVSLKTIIDELRKESSSLEICQPVTLRSLLTMRLVEQASTVRSDDEGAETDDQVQNWLPTGLPQSQLDEIYCPAEILDFAKLLPKGRTYNQFYERLRLDICSVCSKAKFNIRLDTHPRYQSVKWLNEYLGQSRYFTCCQEKVCKECFKKHLLEALGSGWWHKLGKLQWFPCPRTGCDEVLGIRCEADLQICLERSLGIEADEYVKMYVKAVAFRQALQTLDPKPSDDALKKAAEITQHFVKAKRMYSPFDPRFDVASVDETGCIPEFKPGTIYNAVMDNDPSPIPLFLKFFRRQATPKECMACSKAMFDIDYGSVEAWKATCDSFKGSWMWNLLVFPTSEIQQCDHDFEICRACTAVHIRNTLVSGGPSACENLTCPQCSRKLVHQEIHQLADADTVAKYEKFLLQTYLSKEENFRWCLNPLCPSGQIYQRTPRNPKISCEVCHFEMCFKHEMPWHERQTCAEYESQRDYGDPNFVKTQAWIRTNTKECPNPTCEVNIQKGEKCFHMKCSQCSHEFCWQCLAAWQDIIMRGKEGHNEGCFFRTNDVSAMGIRGETLEAALQARSGN